MLTDLALLRAVQDLCRHLESVPTLSDLYRGAVAGLLSPLGFDRAALFLYDPVAHEMRGTWGTDDGQVVDESHYRSYLGHEKTFLAEALASPDHLKVWEDRPLTLWDQPVGHGWNAMVVLQDGERVLGWLALDNARTQRPLAPLEREVLGIYGRNLSTLIQRKQFEDLSTKYLRQNELKDKLFTILAHDLRGPIGNLSVLLGMAYDQPLEPEDLREILGESRQAAQRTYNLVENVLGWVRSQIEEVAALRDRLPVARPLASVQVWLEASARAKGVRLRLDCPETLSVVGDERMIETVVRNLVSNAIKYSPSGSEVVLRGARDGDWVVLEVVDHGVGMPPEKVAQLWSGQKNRSLPGTSGEGGNGLGLMFSADLATALGGRLEAESVEGHGSTFRLRLPDEVDGELPAL